MEESPSWIIRELEHLSNKEGWDSWGCSASGTEGLGEYLAMFINVWREYKDVPRLNSGFGDRKQDNGHKLKHRRFSLNIRKHFFTVRDIDTDCLEGLCCLLLGGGKPKSSVGWSWVTGPWCPHISRGVGQGHFHRSLPMSATVWVCDSNSDNMV